MPKIRKVTATFNKKSACKIFAINVFKRIKDSFLGNLFSGKDDDSDRKN